MKKFFTIAAIFALFVLYILCMTWGEKHGVVLDDSTGENIPVPVHS